MDKEKIKSLTNKKMGYSKLTETVSNVIKELISEHKLKYTESKLNSKKQKLVICD